MTERNSSSGNVWALKAQELSGDHLGGTITFEANITQDGPVDPRVRGNVNGLAVTVTGVLHGVIHGENGVRGYATVHVGVPGGGHQGGGFPTRVAFALPAEAAVRVTL